MEGLVEVVNALTLFRVPPSPQALELAMFALLGESSCRFWYTTASPPRTRPRRALWHAGSARFALGRPRTARLDG